MMKKTILLVLTTAMAATTSAQQAAKPVTGLAEMETILAKIATYQYGQSREPLAQFTQLVEQSLPFPAQLKQIEARLLQLLQSSATSAAKDYAFRELSLIATDASVRVLANMLTRSETAEMARYALARIPGAAADEALRRTLPKVSGDSRIGIINSLGQRRDAKSVPILRPLLLSPDGGVGEAAAAALAAIADQPAMDALATARGKVTGSLQQRITEAYIQCAGQMAVRGNKGAALKVYKELTAAPQPERIRIAALGGLAETDARVAIPALTAELNSQSPEVQTVAIRFLSRIEGSEVTSSLVRQFPKLPPSGQVRLLVALADRGDVSAALLFVSAVKNGTGDIRAAALSGLGKLGDRTIVSLLAEAAATSQGPEQAAARSSLHGLGGPGIDEATVSALQQASGKTKVELIMAAGERGIAVAADILIAAVQEKDADVHREALRALRNVAGPAQVPALLQLLVQASTASDRREATQTLATVLRRSESAKVDTVVSAYKATGAMEARLAFLEVLGQTSSDEALSLLRGSLKDPAPEIARAAILALSEWATPAPVPDLLAVARSEGNATLQVLGLRGYLKLMALPSQRPAAEGARMLAEAMQLARQPAEKRTALSLLANFPCKESLQVAEAARRDPQVAKEAAAAVERINSLVKFQ